jgi:hypothetical protein
MVRMEAECENGHEFWYYAFSTADYGMRSANTPIPDDFAYLNGLTDSVFRNVANLVDDLLQNTGKTDHEVSDCFDRVLQVACDLAPSGLPYNFSYKHWCPICRSTRLVKIDDTGVGEMVDILVVTHEHWDKLTPEEKRGQLCIALKQASCL